MDNSKYQYLSSTFTLFYKFLIPIILGIMSVGISRKVFYEFQNGYTDKSWGIFIIVIIFIIYWFVKYKSIIKIKTNGTDYIISNYYASITIKVNDVSEVEEKNILGKMVVIKLSRDTKLGKEIRFIPQRIPTPDFNKYALVGIIAKFSGLKVSANLNKAFRQES